MSSAQQLGRIALLAVLASAAAFAQSLPDTAVPNPPTSAATTDLPEISTSTEEQTQSFQVKVNLVEVRVVVRDAQGRAIGNLKQDDFVLLDDKKAQTIKKFSVERNEAEAAGKPGAAATTASTPGEVRSHLAPERFVAYFFDDLHLEPTDVSTTR